LVSVSSVLEEAAAQDMASESHPLVTIGVPTYMRPQLLERALACVARQNYCNIELIVADNATPGTEVSTVVNQFRSRVGNLVFIRHPRNIGAHANFLALLDAANGKYFMWLADDDEISDNYIASLVEVLEKNPDAATATGHWITVFANGVRWPRSTSNFPQKSTLVRALRYIWRTDDAFFYALHRTSAIRQASFPGYWWPNRLTVLSWGYVFLLDMVLRGRIVLASDRSVEFVNYNDVPKQYDAGGSGLAAIARYVVRQVNVHFLYQVKIARLLGALAVVPAGCVSIAAMCREFGSYFCDIALIRMRRWTARNPE